jgi:hypothetical protein
MVRRVTINLSPVLAKMLTLNGNLSSYLITLICTSGSFSAKAIIDLVFSMFGVTCSYNEHGFEQPLSLSNKSKQQTFAAALRDYGPQWKVRCRRLLNRSYVAMIVSFILAKRGPICVYYCRILFILNKNIVISLKSRYGCITKSFMVSSTNQISLGGSNQDLERQDWQGRGEMHARF